jgi:hypothetical protein
VLWPSVGPLPLLFADALFRSHPDPTVLPRAVAYISFYLLSWSPMFWIYGVSLLFTHVMGTQCHFTMPHLKILYLILGFPRGISSVGPLPHRLLTM